MKGRVLDRHRRSALQVHEARTTPDKDVYLEALERLRHHMIMFGLGYGDRIRAMGFTNLNFMRDKPQASTSYNEVKSRRS
jgi:hypothetical protein